MQLEIEKKHIFLTDKKIYPSRHGKIMLIASSNFLWSAMGSCSVYPPVIDDGFGVAKRAPLAETGSDFKGNRFYK
jgi:hypothetical protein